MVFPSSEDRPLLRLSPHCQNKSPAIPVVASASEACCHVFSTLQWFELTPSVAMELVTVIRNSCLDNLHSSSRQGLFAALHAAAWAWIQPGPKLLSTPPAKVSLCLISFRAKEALTASRIHVEHPEI